MLLWINNLPDAPAGGGAVTPSAAKRARLLTVIGGTTTPVITIGIPGNTSDDISANFGPGGMGIMFDTAICAPATTGVADADTGAPAANDVIINVFYK